MPRTLDATQLFRKLTDLSFYRLKTAPAGSTTSTGALTVGQTTLTVGSVTNFASADPVILSGSGGVELNEVVAAASTNGFVLLYKAAVAQNAGASIQEATRLQLGHLEENGLQISPSFAQTAIRSAIADLPIQYIPGQAEIVANFGLLEFVGQNWQTAFGIPESEIGTGIITDPYQVYIGGTDFGTQTLQVLRAAGTLFSGDTVYLDFNDARIEVQGSVNLNRQNAAAIPCAVRCSSMTFRYY
jgi:hypothetical protein